MSQSIQYPYVGPIQWHVCLVLRYPQYKIESVWSSLSVSNPWSDLSTILFQSACCMILVSRHHDIVCFIFERTQVLCQDFMSAPTSRMSIWPRLFLIPAGPPCARTTSIAQCTLYRHLPILLGRHVLWHLSMKSLCYLISAGTWQIPLASPTRPPPKNAALTNTSQNAFEWP